MGLVIVIAALVSAGLWLTKDAERGSAYALLAAQQSALSGGASITATMVGHEFRQDDLPSIAAAPDGTLWVAWLSFVGDRDDVAIRHYANGLWGNIQWVPGTSGDSWLPQIGVESSNRVWVVWSQMKDSNWDLYARPFSVESQEWGAIERLTADPLPDINPRLASDGKGRLAVVWQGWRGKNANIFLRSLEGGKWGGEVRVTNRAANDWEPSGAFDSSGAIWVAYDSYAKGNYDVSVTRVRGGKAETEMTVAGTPRFEARATIAVDKSDRLWVAWEAGQPNWGKDQGYILRNRRVGVPLGGVREPRIRCLVNGQWQEPAQPLASAFPEKANTYQPHVFSDGAGSVWVAAKTRVQRQIQQPGGNPANRGWWEYRLTRLDGDRWRESSSLPDSLGRSSTRINAAIAQDGALWLAWDSDNRTETMHHRPIRQQVYAGRIAAPASVTATLQAPGPEESLEVVPGHADEAGDLRAIRTHTARIGNRDHRIVRGDFHRHTELSWDGGGAADGSLQDFYRYMIDAASMDFGASTDHQGGAWPYWWWYTQKMTDMYHLPGVYAAIFGYERSAVFPNGHRNMFFARRSDSRVTPFHLREGVQAFRLGAHPMGDEPGVGSGDLVANDTKLLYEDIRSRNAIAISHTSGTRMGTDWRDNDPELEPVVEIYQGARTSYERLGDPFVVKAPEDQQHMNTAGYQPEGMVHNAWTKGYKLGIITSSDHGSTHISYALVYTPDFSRQGILDAIRKRHTYGATDNIILEVRMGQYFMGDEFTASRAAPIRVKARGTGPVARVDIVKDNEVVYTAQPKTQSVDFEYADKSALNGRHFYYVRLQQENGMIAWSSPFFINYK
jgi:hypothetical protein